MKKNNDTNQVNVHKEHRKRMKNKYKSLGADSFMEHELLEILLFYSIPRINTNPIAHNLLKRFNSLSGILSATSEEICSVDGVGEETATLIKLINDISIRAKTTTLKKGKKILNYTKITEHIISFFDNRQTEVFYIFFLDKGNRFLGQHKIAEGGIDSIFVETSSIVREAIKSNAFCVIMAHNHPGGEINASDIDIDTTRVVLTSLRAAGITLAEHFIIADGKAYPMLEEVIERDYLV